MNQNITIDIETQSQLKNSPSPPSGWQTVMIPLSFLPIDSCAEILELSGDASFCKRLEEMGLQPGVEVRVLRQGSPCILACQGVESVFD